MMTAIEIWASRNFVLCCFNGENHEDFSIRLLKSDLDNWKFRIQYIIIQKHHNLFLFIINEINDLMIKSLSILTRLSIEIVMSTVIQYFNAFLLFSLKILRLHFWYHCCIPDAAAHNIQTLRMITYWLRIGYILLRNQKNVVIVMVQRLHRYISFEFYSLDNSKHVTFEQ